MKEVWKFVPEYEGLYEASNQGRIKSVRRQIKGPRGCTIIKKEKILVPWKINKSGHSQVALYKNGSIKQKYIHYLVLITFVGPCPIGMECRHLNGNPSDNRWPENIIWGTRKENAQDKIKHGKSLQGEKCHLTKLTSENVLEIKRQLKNGETCLKISKEYGVSREAISAIKNKRSWWWLI